LLIFTPASSRLSIMLMSLPKPSFNHRKARPLP
jgi:hypothetical protein